MAEGGFQVEAFARLLYPGGYFINAPYGEYQQAYHETLELLKQDEVIIYEAAFLHEGLFVMTDILVKKKTIFALLRLRLNPLIQPKTTHLLVSWEYKK